jgi:hypothetical protein
MMTVCASFVLAESTLLLLFPQALRRTVCVWFMSAHAAELVPLLEMVESVYGGWESVISRLIRLQGEEHGHMLVSIAAYDASPCLVFGREYSLASHPPGPPWFGSWLLDGHTWQPSRQCIGRHASNRMNFVTQVTKGEISRAPSTLPDHAGFGDRFAAADRAPQKRPSSKNKLI